MKKAARPGTAKEAETLTKQTTAKLQATCVESKRTANRHHSQTQPRTPSQRQPTKASRRSPTRTAILHEWHVRLASTKSSRVIVRTLAGNSTQCAPRAGRAALPHRHHPHHPGRSAAPSRGAIHHEELVGSRGRTASSPGAGGEGGRGGLEGGINEQGAGRVRGEMGEQVVG